MSFITIGMLFILEALYQLCTANNNKKKTNFTCL